MNGILTTSLVIGILSIASLRSADAEEPCNAPKQVASAAMETLPNGLVYAPVVIANHSLRFMVETDLRVSLIAATPAASLSLPRERASRWNVRFYGDRLQEFATANAANFGGMTGKVRFAVAPDGPFDAGLSGVLAADFLRNFDVDFDFARGRINLFSPEHCQGGVVYWTKSGASVVPLQVSPWGEIGVDGELDGKSIRVLLATGWARSEMQIAEDETKFGVQGKDWKIVKAVPVHGSWNSPAVYEHVFKSLAIDGIQVSNVDLTIRSGARPFVGAVLHLGMDVLRQLHLYIAYKERNLYVSAASAGAASASPEPTALPPPQSASSASPAH